jgi:dTDP-3-amino-3,4,6-trideoxy-alpha-D-glucose transaminase
MTIDVPFLDLDAAYVELRPQIDAAVSGVLASGRYLLGAQTEAFEAEFAAACSAAHCVTVGSGCDALELSLTALGVGPGDEVIVPAHTFIATWLAVSRCGARPVPVEPSPDGYLVDVEAVEAAVTPRTAAILVVHLYGEVADLAAIRQVADRHGLALVEDAAQSTGARGRDGAVVGSGSTAAAFSFYPGKNLGALGDGGAVVTDDDDLARRVRLLRNYGSVAKYVHEVRGTNSRLDEIQAAVLRAKLPLLDAWNARRATIAALYLDRLEEASGVRLPPHDQGRSAWHLFVVRCHDRETLQRELTRHGVETLVHYPTPVHLSAAYADHGHRAGSLPHAERLAREVLSLPIGPHLALPAAERVADLVAVLAARP